MKKLAIVLYVLAAVLLVITIIDAVQHQALKPLYAGALAGDLCIASALLAMDKKGRKN